MATYTLATDEDILKLADKFGTTPTLRRILRLVQKIAGGSCLVREEDNAFCPVYSDEYKNAYKNLFSKPSKTCTRLHFFKTPPNAHEDDGYIGFCTLRPRKPTKISYAIFRAPYGKDRDSYSLSKGQFKEKFGKGFESKVVNGYPFIQQDGVYDCCAHVALLGMNWFFASQGLSKKMNIASIVKLSSKVPTTGRDFPSSGLGIVQIVHVLKEMGMSPLVYTYPPTKGEFQFPPDRIIYHYIESGLPVLVGIPAGNAGHALVVTGHTVSPDTWWPEASKEYYDFSASGLFYHCSTDWLEDFIICDDNFGPYLTVHKAFFNAKSQKDLLVIVALPKQIILKGEDAEIYAYKSISNSLYAETEKLPKESSSRFWSEHFWQHYRNIRENDPLKPRNIVLRTFLMKGKELAQIYLKGDFPDAMKSLIGRTPLPSYVWVTELSTPGLFAQNRKYLGRIVLDPTGNPRICPNLLLIRHLPGFVHCRNAKTEVTDRYVFANDHPRGHLAR
jgi:hypothetical protein